MIRRAGVATIYALLITLSTARFCVADATPHQFLGTWEVIQMAVDLADQPHWRYEPNDPRIVGRTMTIGADGAIDFNFSRELCGRVDWIAKGKTRLSTLIGKTFPRPPHPGLAKAPTLQDFNLSVPNTTVTPYRPLCASSTLSSGKGSYWGDAWFVSLSPEKMLVEYDGDTILLLRKVHAAKPSFTCSGNLSPTETAICSSVALAGYDRSVASALRRKLQREPKKKRLQEEEQQDWLQKRNQCKSDPVCIENRMRERIDVLMQD